MVFIRLTSDGVFQLPQNFIDTIRSNHSNSTMQSLKFLCAICLSSTAIASAAPETALPDPTTISVPDVTPSADPKIREDGYKFYYFHSPDVSFETAYQDLRDCRAHLVSAGPAAVPGFIPWGEQHRREVFQGTPMYGIVGVAMAAIIVPKMIRGQHSNKMRRCMGTRGYDRYAIAESVFDKLNDGEEQQLILMQAKLASGPKPADEVVMR
ncbi:hypothetical protein [Sphingorhabdus sp.]|jgi:hypothetical protein|uniref:hypothetical protein n=1 Tax=Sphingorhabdus sp. TaxID=1902408 RepID=UPI003BAEFC62|nr:hypothetical protein [Sphingomonadales bacterium]MBK9431145.1 hypothetical protein [Sphingomonadales bacterium]MBL0021282.1 hypothetical protein [Sphingomonadales bacterium]